MKVLEGCDCDSQYKLLDLITLIEKDFHVSDMKPFLSDAAVTESLDVADVITWNTSSIRFLNIEAISRRILIWFSPFRVFKREGVMYVYVHALYVHIRIYMIYVCYMAYRTLDPRYTLLYIYPDPCPAPHETTDTVYH